MTATAVRCSLTPLSKAIRALSGALSFLAKRMAIVYRGERFEDYNVPKRTPRHPSKSHAVLAKKGDMVKLVRFGSQGAKTYPPRDGESKADAGRRKAWYARHADSLKGATIFDAIYWAAKVKW